MIASKKLGHPYLLFARANCVRTVSICTCRLFFICRNESINGFGTTGFEFSSSNLKGLANIRITVVFRIGFSNFFDLDWMRNLLNEHHLAAKIGTYFSC
jgi:hypothetical protein